MNCECGQPVKARGLCAKHYLAEYRARKANGQINKTSIEELEATQNGQTYDLCAIGYCNRPIRSLSLCSPHYLQLNRYKKREHNVL